MAAAACLNYGTPAVMARVQQKQTPSHGIQNLSNGNSMLKTTWKSVPKIRQGKSASSSKIGGAKCSLGIGDFIGGDLLKLDLGKWLSDVEEHKALAIYSPHEGGYEGRYLNRLRYEGYYFLDLSARGLGDPETTLLKVHPVCPAHVGKQPIARWYFPPEVDYRLSALPPDAKGLVVWIIEAKVLSKSELQFLALLPTLRPNVRVIAECGNWRKFMWKPLKDIAGLTADPEGNLDVYFHNSTIAVSFVSSCMDRPSDLRCQPAKTPMNVNGIQRSIKASILPRLANLVV